MLIESEKRQIVLEKAESFFDIAKESYMLANDTYSIHVMESLRILAP